MSDDKMTRADIDEILKIVASIDHLVDFHLKYGDLELRVTREGASIARIDGEGGARPASPSPTPTPAPAPAPLEAPRPEGRRARAALPEGMAAIKAPMVGTFYSAPAPGAKPFVEPGARVERDTVVCIIEVMKLMNSIRAGVDGTVREIRVENGEPVEFGQVLLVIEPHA
jgi:acetyl-CoA carboxylase biotin carboxyl carrier protein